MTAEVTIKITDGSTTDGDCEVKFRRESNDGDEVDLGIAIAHAVNAVDIARQMSALAHAVARLYEWNEDAHTAAEEDFAAYAKAVLEHWQEFDRQRDAGGPNA